MACDADQPPDWCDVTAGAAISNAANDGRWGKAVRLAPLWEVGPAVEVWAVNSPNAVALHPTSGVLAIADHSTSTVTFIGPDGRRLARWGTQGSKAGEIALPHAVDWMRDGRLAVLDPVNAKVVFLDTAGRLLSEQRTDSLRRLGIHEVGTILMEADIIIRREGPDPRAGSSDATPERQDHILWASNYGATVRAVTTAPVRLSSVEANTPLPGTALPVAAPLEDTLLAVAGDIPELRIRIINRSGRVIREICRVTPPLPLSPAESAAAKRLGQSESAERRARVGRLLTGVDGRIWAQRNRPTGALLADHWFGPLGAGFDVFTRDGEYLGQITAPGDTRLVAARGDTVVGIRYQNAGAVAVAAYRILHPD
jgi:hypothetical protein